MFVLPLIAAVVAAVAQVGSVDMTSDRIEVSGDGHRRTIPCEGRHVEVAGVNHVLVFTGTCASLELTGSGNRVTIGLAPGAVLDVAGTDHVVHWHSSGQPQLALAGANNRVDRMEH